MSPELSVVMPVYNVEDYVDHAVASVRAQTFEDFEFIVVDDGSTDDTLARVRSIPDPRIRIERLPTNVGFVNALNRGIAVARGRWIARMDGDDICHPKRFEIQLSFLNAHPGVVLVGSLMSLLAPDGETLAVPDYSGRSWRYVTQEMLLQNRQTFSDPSAVFSRAAAMKAGCYDSDLQLERTLWCKLLEHGQAAVLMVPLYFNRFVAGSVSRSTTPERARRLIVFFERYDRQGIGFPPSVPEKLPRAFDDLANASAEVSLYLLAGRRGLALRKALWAIRRSVVSPLPYRLLGKALLERRVMIPSHPRGENVFYKAVRLDPTFRAVELPHPTTWLGPEEKAERRASSTVHG